MGEGEADEPPLQDRIRSFAKSHAADRSASYSRAHDPSPPFTPPLGNQTSSYNAGRSASTRFSASSNLVDGSDDREHISHNHVPDTKAEALPPPAPPPPSHTQDASDKSPSVGSIEKPGWSERLKGGAKRFIIHMKDAIFHSWINVLLVFVPVGIGLNWAPIAGQSKPTIIFAMNAVAIVPLAGLLSHATESVASKMGDTWASLLNVTFGNAVELIIFIALIKNEIRIVQASILGSILANLLLILGMAFLLGGLRFREQIYNSTITQMSACLLSLSVTSLLLPTAFHAAFADSDEADDRTIKISRGTSVVLLLVYVLYLLFQLKSHAYMYESTPQQVIDEESHPGVLADFINSSSSSSDDSETTASTISDSSASSQNTAKKRIKRALTKRRRRKSSASSNATISSPSTIPSPRHERRNIFDDPSTPPNEGYFGQTDAQRSAQSGAAVFSGDEADTDGENDRTAPHVRDFQNEQRDEGESSLSAKNCGEGGSKSKRRKKSKSKHKHKKHVVISEKAPEPKERPVLIPEVEEPPARTPTPNVTTDGGLPLPVTASPRRNFARTISRGTFRPPPFLSNTVFTTPQPPPAASGVHPLGLSIANRGGLRRTSSLPDRLNRQVSARQVSSRQKPQMGQPTVAPRSALPASPAAAATDPEVKPDPTNDDHKPEMSRTSATVLLLCTTALVAFCAELLVDAIPALISNTTISQAFIGLIILPIVGNAAEHVTAVTVATKNKMDLAIGVAVGSSIQIALFVTPFVVLLGWVLGKDMSLYFNLFETVCLFVTAFVVNFLVLDGRSNYLEGSLLIAAYAIIAVSAFFYPNEGAQSELGGNNGP